MLMKKVLSTILPLLISITTTLAAEITKPVSAQFGFIENKGQIIDQKNLPNKAVLFLYNGNGLHVQLRQSGFSYEVLKNIKSKKVNTLSDLPPKLRHEEDTKKFMY